MSQRRPPDSTFDVPVPDARVERVTAWIDEPRDAPERDAAILLAHGAGAPPDSPFLTRIAGGLAGRGFRVMRFRYAYMQRTVADGKRRPPDRTAVLESTHRAALAALRQRVGERRILLVGKSLGGRMGSHLAAQGEDCAGLVFLGYPLHPAGRPERERSEHFPALCQPALFLQGTRDALCDLARLERALVRYGGNATLHVVDGADHGFGVSKRFGRTPDEVVAELLDAVDAWEAQCFPS